MRSLLRLFQHIMTLFQQKDSFFRSLVAASKNSAEIFAALNARPEIERNQSANGLFDDEEHEKEKEIKSVTAF